MRTTIKLNQLKDNLHHLGFVSVKINSLILEIQTNISKNISTYIIKKKCFEYFGEVESLTYQQSARIIRFFGKIHQVSIENTPLKVYLKMAEIEKQNNSSPKPLIVEEINPNNFNKITPNDFITEDPKIEAINRWSNWLQSYQDLQQINLSKQDCITNITEGKYTLSKANLIATALIYVNQEPTPNVYEKALFLVKNNSLLSLEQELFWVALQQLPVMEFIAVVIAIVHYEFLINLPDDKTIKFLTICQTSELNWVSHGEIIKRQFPLKVEIEKPETTTSQKTVETTLKKINVNPHQINTRAELIKAVYEIFGVENLDNTKAFHQVKKWVEAQNLQSLNLRTTEGWRELLTLALA